MNAFELAEAEIGSRDSAYPFADIVSKINSMDTTWKAEIPKRFIDHTEEEMTGVINCSKKDPNFKNLPIAPKIEMDLFIPDAFDSRTNWPNCSKTIGLIRDQSNCGSCWAFGAAEAMSDRICIKSMAATIVNISAEDINDCCRTCGEGCNGGYPLAAWMFYKNDGVVTGGNCMSKSGCKPYSLKSCDHHIPNSPNPCPEKIARTPRCQKMCMSG
ncbi:C1 family peptidase, partial [Salmonella sp. s51228]|uniref:C1 family peptidase n=1 Tax=Salmonella sp. s51228 TaxID=3159652 RepID=UPI0039802961